MKKILSIMSLIIIVLALASCFDNVDYSNDEEVIQPTEETVERDPVNYTVYADFSMGSQISLESEEISKVTLKPASEKEFSFIGRDFVDRPENTNDTFEVQIRNELYEFGYFGSRKIFSSSNTSKLKNREIVNVYLSDTRHIEISAGDERPLFFFTNSNQRVTDGDFTEEEAVEAAKSVIAELYGADAIEGYSRIKFSDDGEPKEDYSIGFRKKIFGYDTNDTVIVSFDMAGNFIGFNAYKYGILENAEKDLTKEEIEKAIAYVEDTFSDNWDIGTPSVVADTEGDYYIEVGLSRKKGEIIEAMQIHVNIR